MSILRRDFKIISDFVFNKIELISKSKEMQSDLLDIASILQLNNLQFQNIDFFNNKEINHKTLFNLKKNILKFVIKKDIEKEIKQNLINSNMLTILSKAQENKAENLLNNNNLNFILINCMKDFFKLTEEDKIFIINNLNDKEFEKVRKIFELNSITSNENKMKITNIYLNKDNNKLCEKDNNSYMVCFEKNKELSMKIALNMEKEENNLKKQSLLRKELEKENKKEILNNTKKETHLYNQQYYDFIEKHKFSMKQEDIIKIAYFRDGVDLDEFENIMSHDIENLDNEQLQNDLEFFVDYKNDYISKEDFNFIENVTFKGDISQKEIKEDVFPALKNKDLSKKELEECINSGLHSEYGKTSQIIDTAVSAHDFHYSDMQVFDLIRNAKHQSKETLYEEQLLIKELGNHKLKDINYLKDIDCDGMHNLRMEKNTIIEKIDNLTKEDLNELAKEQYVYKI